MILVHAMLSVHYQIYMGIVICNLQLASRSPSTESETGCEEKIDEAGEAFVEYHITQQTLAGYLGKSLKIEDCLFFGKSC